jgi:hypothetical protein
VSVWREGELHGEWIPAVKDCVNCFRLWLSDCAACTGRASWTLVPDPLMFFVARTFNSCARMARVGTHEDHGTRDLIAHDAAYTQMHTHAHTHAHFDRARKRQMALSRVRLERERDFHASNHQRLAWRVPHDEQRSLPPTHSWQPEGTYGMTANKLLAAVLQNGSFPPDV